MSIELGAEDIAKSLGVSMATAWRHLCRWETKLPAGSVVRKGRRLFLTEQGASIIAAEEATKKKVGYVRRIEALECQVLELSRRLDVIVSEVSDRKRVR